jgi:hypothetical protein
MGLAAKIDISENTELSYYIGTVYATVYNPVGNHGIEVRSCGRTNLCLNASRLPKDLPLGCSMHMANHSCNPNCQVTPFGTMTSFYCRSVAKRNIVSGEAVTFQYKGSVANAP